MTTNFDNLINQILQQINESHTLMNPPSSIEVAPNSDAAKFLQKPKNRSSAVYQSYSRVVNDWTTYRQRPVWKRLDSTSYSDRIGVRGVNVTLNLPGPAAPRIIGKIENDTFYVYWLGSHEDYNSVY